MTGYRGAVQAGQPVELYGRFFSWRHEGRWSLRPDPLESARRELLESLERQVAQAQAQADLAALHARREQLAALPPAVRGWVTGLALARALAAGAGDPAWRKPPQEMRDCHRKAASLRAATVAAHGTPS